MALLVAVTLTAAACARESTDPNVVSGPTTTTEAPDTTSSSTATTDGEAGFTPAPIEWSDCNAVECATVSVPLDYDQPDGERIDLFVVRAPATGERKGALFTNPGGPGASAASFAERLAGVLPDGLTERFDIVGVDPRGVGGSAPIRCGGSAATLYGVDASIDDAMEAKALLDASERYVTSCARKYPDLLPHIGTRDDARDIDVVRAAMGDDTISYLGFSYGTALGQVYADLFPERVRAMVLDGVLELGPTGLELAEEQAAGFETALARFVDHCDTSDCEIKGNALPVVEAVLALSEKPGGIPAPRADRPAGPGEANLGISYALYSKRLWPDLDHALVSARAGDASDLVRLADAYLGIGGFEVYFAVNCMDFAWPTGDPDAFLAAAKATARKSPHFGEALVNDYIRCVDWPVAPDPLRAVTAPGTPPIVVISTTGDPATPYTAGVLVARTLVEGVLVTNEGDGHTVVADGKPCIDDIVTAYFVDGDVPEDGTTCR